MRQRGFDALAQFRGNANLGQYSGLGHAKTVLRLRYKVKST